METIYQRDLQRVKDYCNTDKNSITYCWYNTKTGKYYYQSMTESRRFYIEEWYYYSEEGKRVDVDIVKN